MAEQQNLDTGFRIDPLTTPREYKDNPMDRQFAPKNPVQLEDPKHDVISQEELAACNGEATSRIWIERKARVWMADGLFQYRLESRQTYLCRNQGYSL